ncbi:secreted trypsin-like serine protease [Nitzschia inconspicua]|uniref:Secreted trypsin-like serine protease n=1 Tax=Nitzschia inconspicua TaxID=303405 RepID=A0A9K3KW74_9STRA|nr:secreted trypsin-like serine protease [Nitzschia inconspicua]
MPRIIGGQDAVPGLYPFFASLTIGGGHSCGGSLIAPDIILSAAHCTNLNGAEVGRSIRSDPNDTYETFELIKEIRHPVYDNEAYKFDFMILQLDRPASDRFTPIRLNKDEALPVLGIADGVKAIGFGATATYEDGSNSGAADVLQEVGLHVIDNEECMLAKGTEYTDEAFANGYAGLITPDMLCAQDDNQDTCFGDSGGPLMIQEWNEYIQVGVTSWGFGCGDNDYPGVYSRVSHQYEWIRTNVCELSVNPPAYFECDAPTLAPAQDVQVTIALTFDDFPDEISMMIIDETGFGVTLVDFPADSFLDSDPRSTFYHTVSMKERSTYTFIIIDAKGDGLCCYDEGGSYLVYVGTEGVQGEILVSGGGDFGEEISHQFTVPAPGSVVQNNDNPTATTTPGTQVTTQSPTGAPTYLPTVSPTVQPSATPSLMPSSSPTITPSPTSSPTRAPTTTPSSSPTESLAPSQIPTPVPQRMDKAQVTSLVLGVLVVLAVACLFIATSWYADRHTRLQKVQAEVPFVK